MTRNQTLVFLAVAIGFATSLHAFDGSPGFPSNWPVSDKESETVTRDTTSIERQ